MSIHTAQAGDCSARRAESLKRHAQALDPSVDAEGASFVKECPQVPDDVLAWLLYFHRSRGEYAKAAALTKDRRAGSVTGSERDRLLALAAAGEAEELERKVRRGESGYSDDAEALLLLARAMARNKRFGDARAHYARYLKAKPGDRDVEIESAYTLLWEGNGRTAELEFQRLNGATDLSDSQEASIRAGLVQALRLDFAVDRPVMIAPPTLGFGAELLTATFYGFSRASTGLEYRGESFSATALTHWLSSSRAGDGSYGALEGWVGASHRLDEKVGLSAKLGGFSTGRSAVIGEALGELRLDSGLMPYAGVYQSALAKDVPLPEDLSGATRGAIFAGMRYRSVLDTRLELRSFSGFTSSRHLSARFAIPIKDLEGHGAGAGGVSLAFSAENESFTTSSTYLYSPRSTTALRAGVDYLADFNEAFSGKFGLSYGTVLETPQTGSGLTFGSSASLVAASADLGYRISASTQGLFRLRFDQTRGEQGGTTYGATVFGLAFRWRLGGDR